MFNWGNCQLSPQKNAFIQMATKSTILDLSGLTFSVVRQVRRGGGGGEGRERKELRGLDAKNQGQHHSIKMKRYLSHDNHKSIPATKFKADSSSSFEDMTSQNFPRKKGTSHQIRLFTPEKRVIL